MGCLSVRTIFRVPPAATCKSISKPYFRSTRCGAVPTTSGEPESAFSDLVAGLVCGTASRESDGRMERGLFVLSARTSSSASTTRSTGLLWGPPPRDGPSDMGKVG